MSITFRIGDHVRVKRGRGKTLGIITEDRGAIGLRGRRFYEVRVSSGPFDPTTYELPEEEIEPIGEPLSPSMERRKIIAYLVHGGLVEILNSKQAGGRSQPRVWMQPDSLGNVTHAFEDWGDSVGGQVVPFMVLHGEKIFEPKREEVLALLQSFGLDRAEAEKVVAKVGTAP